MASSGSDHDDLDSGWDDGEDAAESDAGDAIDAAWDDVAAEARPPGRRRPSRKRRQPSNEPVAATSPSIVRPAPAATPSAKHVRRKLEREARARAAAAKRARKAEDRARRAATPPPSGSGSATRQPAPEPTPKAKTTSRPRPVPAPAREQRAKPVSKPAKREAPAKRSRSNRAMQRADEARARKAHPKRAMLSTSSPIVLLALFALVAGLVIYFASR